MRKISRFLLLIMAINLTSIFLFSNELRSFGISDRAIFITELTLLTLFVLVEIILWVSKRRNN